MWIGESKVAKADVMSVSPSSEPKKLSTGADLHYWSTQLKKPNLIAQFMSIFCD